MNTHYYIPRDKTLNDYLSEIGDTPCHSSEFIEINKRGMVTVGVMDDADYEIFWKCMRVYESLGINYFADYIYLCQAYYGDFSHGIEHWFNDKSFMGMRPDSKTFREFVEKLLFFDIKSYHGIPLSEYEKAYQKADIFYYRSTENEKQRHQEKANKTISDKIKNYYNYDTFSEKVFSDLSETLIKDLEKNLTINEALQLARSASANTYIVVLKNNKGICHIGKTKQPFSYIEKQQKNFDATSAYFKIIDSNYIDDIVVYFRILYDVELDKIHLSNSNRKYATVKQAIYAYSRTEGITSKQIMLILDNHRLRTVPIKYDQVLIDKLALAKALYD